MYVGVKGDEANRSGFILKPENNYIKLKLPTPPPSPEVAKPPPVDLLASPPTPPPPHLAPPPRSTILSPLPLPPLLLQESLQLSSFHAPYTQADDFSLGLEDIAEL